MLARGASGRNGTVSFGKVDRDPGPQTGYASRLGANFPEICSRLPFPEMRHRRRSFGKARALENWRDRARCWRSGSGVRSREVIASAGAALRCLGAPRCPRCHERVSFLSSGECVFSNWRQQSVTAFEVSYAAPIAAGASINQRPTIRSKSTYGIRSGSNSSTAARSGKSARNAS